MTSSVCKPVCERPIIYSWEKNYIRHLHLVLLMGKNYVHVKCPKVCHNTETITFFASKG